ncbi:tyrosine-type recombinase/integrase [Nonomuraea sp. NPDC050556]|uniref:tyrosine-type recombinase/integrase n=1 Tax=Nonomuraea sp. NPDC050556 TaxID=3364369 RepID=UPI00378C0847
MSKKDDPGNPVAGVVVYQRGKKWSYRLELDRDVLSGERQFEYGHGYATREEAWTAAVKAKDDHGRGQRVLPSKRTVAQFFTEWLTSNEHSVKPSTYVNYCDYTNAYVVPIIGKRKLQDVSVPMLNTLYQHLLAKGRVKRDTNTAMYEYWSTRRKAGAEPKPMEISRHCKVSIYAARSAVLRYRRGRVPQEPNPGLAPKTVKNVHRMLHRALGDAVAWRYIEFNPAAHARLPRESRSGKRRRGKTWTPEQLVAWLKVAITDRDAGVWVLIATTGMRRSEAAGAERELLDLVAATLKLGDTRIVVGGDAVASDGKSESGRRTLSLDAFTVAFLTKHVEMLDAEREAFGKDYCDAGLLVCHPDGRPVHPDTITRRFNRLVDRAGVPRIRLHDVRHTYATVSLDAGVDPKILADRIGHASMSYTFDIYTHPTVGTDRESAEKIARLIFGVDGPQLP